MTRQRVDTESLDALGPLIAPMPAADAAEARPSRAALLRAPLVLKLLGANALLVLLAVALSAAVAVLFFDVGERTVALLLFALITAVGLAVTIPLQLALLRVALEPIAALEAAAKRVESGDYTARVAVSPLADPNLARLGTVFNRLLESVGKDRQRLRTVAARAFRAQEAERMRLARELQEECAQRLASVLLRLRVTRHAADAAVRDQQFTELRNEVSDVLNCLRQYARGLFPPVLRDLGLVAALRVYVRSLAESSGLQIDLDADELRPVLSEEQSLALYRILQEALLNAVRHSGARRVDVLLRLRPDAVEATVQDDGHGFDPSERQRQVPCLGLFGMQERALYVEGTATIESRRGQGTRVFVAVPVGGADALEYASTPPAPAAAVAAPFV